MKENNPESILKVPMYQPNLSIIIATKNAKTLLMQTLDNLHELRYPKLEIIVIDGNSEDGTREVLKQNGHKVSKWISEPDLGISDAFNKGLALATGDYINFQGAGDSFTDPDVLSELFAGVASDVDLVCARVLRVEEDGATPIWVSPTHPTEFNPRSLLFKMSLPHQALFTHRRFFDRYGKFDCDVRFAMDYEILLRAYHHFPKTVLKNTVVAKWRAGGVGTNRINEIFEEYHAIKTKHKVANPWLLHAIDKFTHFKYRIKSSQSYQIVKYIVDHNDRWSVPYRLWQAFMYQCQKQFSRRIRIKTLFNGAKIYLFHNNPVASAFVYTPIPDKEEIDALRQLAEPETVFLDIGANIGAYSLLMKDKVKAVYAFEAHPKTRELCQQNFVLNHIDPDQVLGYAVSDDDRPKQFTDLQEGHPTNSRSNTSEGTICVPAITLDQFVKTHDFDPMTPFLVKIDVEGFEHEVFAGAKEFLSHYNVKGIVFENFSTEQDRIITLLHGLGFDTQPIGQNNTFAHPKKELSHAS